MTNKEKIISMTDEELADFFFYVSGNCEAWCPAQDPMDKYLNQSCDLKCEEHFIEWLNSLVK